MISNRICKFSLIYLYIPVLIFFAGWLKTIIFVVCSVLLIYGLVKEYSCNFFDYESQSNFYQKVRKNGGVNCMYTDRCVDCFGRTRGIL